MGAVGWRTPKAQPRLPPRWGSAARSTHGGAGDPHRRRGGRSVPLKTASIPTRFFSVGFWGQQKNAPTPQDPPAGFPSPGTQPRDGKNPFGMGLEFARATPNPVTTQRLKSQPPPSPPGGAPVRDAGFPHGLTQTGNSQFFSAQLSRSGSPTVADAPRRARQPRPQQQAGGARHQTSRALAR